MPATVRILLEGRPGSGKTTVIIRLGELLRASGARATGFFTRERRTGARRTGFELETLDGRRGVLAGVDIRGGPRVGRYGVSLHDLETIVVPTLREAADHEIVLMDELGKMELASDAFTDTVAALLDRPVAVVATVQASRHPFTDELKRRSSIEVIRLTVANRERLPEDLAARLTRRGLGCHAAGTHQGMDRPGPGAAAASSRSVAIPAGGARVQGDLAVPARALGVVVFAHGSGSGRHSPRNRYVAARLVDAGLATLLIDLLTPQEETEDLRTSRLRFDISLLSSRLVTAVDWLRGERDTANLPIGCFGASTGAAAALVAAAERPGDVRAVVSRGGRPDLAGDALRRVEAPTLLVVGGADAVVLDLNRDASEQLRCEVALEVVEHAGHLFEESGALDRVAGLAAEWFARHLAAARGPQGMP